MIASLGGEPIGGGGRRRAGRGGGGSVGTVVLYQFTSRINNGSDS